MENTLTQTPSYGVDLIPVIDATQSMRPVMNVVKQQAIGFYAKLQAALEAKGKAIGRIRISVIAYRDVFVDGEPFVQSPFFELPAQQAEFEQFVNAIEPMGGGDEPENGLEALAMAIRAKVSRDLAKHRHVIVVHTDASAHKFEKGHAEKPANYPADMPASFDALSDEWAASQELSKEAKRLVLFAPDAWPWSDISTHWDNTVHYASRAGQGLSEVDGDTIMDAIVNSIRN
jgi:hypothetical protein